MESGRNAVDAQAVVVVRGEGFLHEYGLSGVERHEGEGDVGGRRCGDVDDVYVRVGHEVLRVGVPVPDMVALCKGTRLLGGAPHDGRHPGVRQFRKGREKSFFGGFTAADKAPFNDIFGIHAAKIRYFCLTLQRSQPLSGGFLV